jgi:hypothetical protein
MIKQAPIDQDDLRPVELDWISALQGLVTGGFQ